MTIALEYSNTDQRADLVRDGGNLGTDDGLETALIISLFTDRRSGPDDPVPNEGGWWGDTYAEVEADRIGSKLWMVHSLKTTEEALLMTEQWALEAVQWMIDDGVAETITVTPERDGQVVMGTIKITRPGEIAPRFKRIWAIAKLQVA